MFLEAELQRLHLGSRLFKKDLGALSYQEGLAVIIEEQSHDVDRSSNTCSSRIFSLRHRGIVNGGLGAARPDIFKSEAV